MTDNLVFTGNETDFHLDGIGGQIGPDELEKELEKNGEIVFDERDLVFHKDDASTNRITVETVLRVKERPDSE